MKEIAIIFLAAAAVVASAKSDPPKDGLVQNVPTVCPQESPTPVPGNQIDFPERSGLEFDPHAPGGARPSTIQESQPAGVDPTTVTLFPPEPTPTPTTTAKEENTNEDHHCP